MDSFYTKKNDGILLKCKIVPNSSKNEISGLYEGALKIKIKAPAVENKANEELIKFLSKLLKVPKTDISLKSGGTSKFKSLYIAGYTVAEFENFCVNMNLTY